MSAPFIIGKGISRLYGFRSDSYSARTADKFSANAAGLNRWQLKAARPRSGIGR
jgi:hypothetical protein